MENLITRQFNPDDEQKVIDLWFECNLVVPWNNPKRDIERKLNENPDLFLIGEIEDEIVATCMAGYDGHRGWIYYLAVKPDYRNKGIASKIVKEAESRLLEMGCPKIDLMVRKTNQDAISFYKKIGYKDDPVVVLSKRLYEDKPYKTAKSN